MTEAVDPGIEPIGAVSTPRAEPSLNASLGDGDDTGPVLVVVGNPRIASRTTTVTELVARRVAAVAVGRPGIEVVELAELGPALLAWGDPAVDDLRRRLAGATALVVASPTYKAAYTGLLKLFVDHLEAGELAGLVTVPVMTGGGPAHALALDVHLTPVLVEVGASIPSRGLYVWGEQQDHPEGAVTDWWQLAEPALHRALSH